MKIKNIPYVKYVPIILISLILYRVVNNLENIGSIISEINSILGYFLCGLIIAYILNPLVMIVEKKMKVNRIVSMLVVYLLFLSLVAATVILAVPVLFKNVMDIVNAVPDVFDKTQKYALRIITENKVIARTNAYQYIGSTISDASELLSGYVKEAFVGVFNSLSNITNAVLKLVTGIVISIYLLKDKEKLLSETKKIVYLFADDDKAYRAFGFLNKVNDVLKMFLVGKILDSLLMGILCFVCLRILAVPYSLFISILFAITNMIPYFGGFIAMGVGCLVSAIFSPFKALEVAIVMIVLGEIDGLYIGPKILGNRIGLSPLWILLAITIGGGLFGVVGMFLGVPVMAVLRILFTDLIEKKEIEEKSLLKNKESCKKQE